MRERLAFTPDQVVDALQQLQQQFPDTEAVLLSTCNRVELYVAAEIRLTCPNTEQLVAFLADYHQLIPTALTDQLFCHSDQEAVRHLFLVAASLDSMVVGEAQILSQVKQAFAAAQQSNRPARSPIMFSKPLTASPNAWPTKRKSTAGG